MRRPDWPEALAAEIAAAAGRPFAWGGHDCVRWAFGVVRAIGGPDLLAPLPRWHDEASAMDAIAAWGPDLLAALSAYLPGQGLLPWQCWQQAQRGDLVCLRVPRRGPTAGICAGRAAFVAAEAGGVLALPMALCARAWRV